MIPPLHSWVRGPMRPHRHAMTLATSPHGQCQTRRCAEERGSAMERSTCNGHDAAGRKKKDKWLSRLAMPTLLLPSSAIESTSQGQGFRPIVLVLKTHLGVCQRQPNMCKTFCISHAQKEGSKGGGYTTLRLEQILSRGIPRRQGPRDPQAGGVHVHRRETRSWRDGWKEGGGREDIACIPAASHRQSDDCENP